MYALGTGARNAAFDAGILRVTRLSVPVVSVGNLTAGGTGKTPMVEYLARLCKERGRMPAVVSRGYGRRSRGVVVVSDGRSVLCGAAEGGDEPVQLASSLPGLIVVVGECRAEAGQLAVRDLRADVVLLDDGFQHRHLARDLDIVVIAAERDPAEERLLPAGLRRERMKALKRAGLVVLSRRGGEGSSSVTADHLARWYSGPVASTEHVPGGLKDAAGGDISPASLSGRTGFAFCGIAGPEGFFRMLGRLGLAIGGRAVFPDHHAYEARDLDRIAEHAAAKEAAYVITTEKDFVRLAGRSDLPAMRLPLIRLNIRLRFVNGEETVLSLLDRCCAVGGT